MLRRRCLVCAALVSGCGGGQPARPNASDAAMSAPPAPVPWVYPPGPAPMSFNSATADRWSVLTTSGRMLCEIPCSTWIPPDEGLRIEHAGDKKAVLRVSKNRIASFEGRPVGLVVRREKSYATAITLLATGVGLGGLGAVLVGFGAAEDCIDESGVLCGAGAVFIGTGVVLSIAAIAIGGRIRSSYELEEVPPWLMGHPLIPPPGYVVPPEMLSAPRPAPALPP